MDSRRTVGIATLIVVMVFASGAMGVTDFSEDGTIGPGEVLETVKVWEVAEVIMTGGFANGISTYNASKLDISGGEVGTIRVLDNSTANLIDGAVFNVVYTLGHGEFTMYDGSIPNSLGVNDSSMVNVLGGYLNTIEVHGEGTANIRGGTIYGHLEIGPTGQVNIYGFDLALDGLGGKWGQGLITGEWEDGVEFDIDLIGGSSRANLFNIPEPTTILLLGFGAIAALRKRGGS